MTYYEELGVAQAASFEEIRRAYRRVARLIHPDHCNDQETRRLADLQMKRLNGLLAVLADGAQRAKYDAALLGCTKPRGTKEAVRLLSAGRDFLLSRARQPALAGVAVLLLLAITLAVWPRRQVVTPNPIVTPPPATLSAPLPKKQSPRQTRQAPRPILSLAPPQAIPAEPPSPSEPPALAAMQIVAAAIPLSEPVPLPPVLAGRWLFVASSSTKHSGYPPEYIELRLNESAGMLHGRYQARYHVTDRAISPNVAFRFDGSAGPGSGTLPWDGPGGAKGEVTLRLLPNGNLEVDWVAHHLGRDLALISGTATLVRKIE